jgi:4'-phosphopantetheinyl transferase
MCPSQIGAEEPNEPLRSAGPVVWSAPPKVLDLVENEIHVWRASLECGPDFLGRLGAVLSKEEKQRASRFHFRRDREFFVAARGVLRHLLGAYLRRPPSELQFNSGRYGKLYIPQEDLDCSPIRFNLSHAGGSALYAFVRGREVGIDLEGIRSEFPGEEIAERFFSAAEVAELRTLPVEFRTEGFFNCWTRKEAYVKAQGAGLQISLDSFDVTLTPGMPAQFVRGVESRWNLVAFAPELNHVAAVVYEGSPCKVGFFAFGLPIEP